MLGVLAKHACYCCYYYSVLKLSTWLFLRRFNREKLNSPASVRVWETGGEYCSSSRKSSCAHKGKYLHCASAWQPLYLFSLLLSLTPSAHAFIIPTFCLLWMFSLSPPRYPLTLSTCSVSLLLFLNVSVHLPFPTPDL